MLHTNITEEMIAQQVRAHMEAEGFIPQDENLQLEMDGEIHRIPVKGDRWGATSGAYYVHADGCPNWGFRDFRKHSEMLQASFNWEAIPFETRKAYYQEQNNYYSDPQARQAEKAEALIRQRKKQQAEAKEKQEAISRACYLYENASFSNVSKHPYIAERFIKKGIHVWPYMYVWDFEHYLTLDPPDNAIKRATVKVITPSGTECRPERLIIPITNTLTREIQSLQTISDRPDSEGKYQKGFLKSTSPKGGCYELIPQTAQNSQAICICEGLCTGLAIIVLTRGQFPVFCAMTSGNIEHVARGLRKRYAGKKIIIMADNDAATAIKNGTNTGIKAANDAKDKGLADIVKPAQIAGRENQNIDWYDVLAERTNNNA